MINIVLAAGYATRLYPLTENFPKPLLKIGHSTILDRLLHDIDSFVEVTEHIVVTNHRFISIFQDWADRSILTKPIHLLDDGSTDNDQRLGAVRDLILALETYHIADDILVAAADNILDFSLRGFVDAFYQKRTSILMCHYEYSIEALQRTGVIERDENSKILIMQEKPEKPVSNWAVPPFYIYKKEDLDLIRSSIKNGCRTDAPGNLAHYMFQRVPMHAWEMPGKRYDIGTLDTYQVIKERFNH